VNLLEVLALARGIDGLDHDRPICLHPELDVVGVYAWQAELEHVPRRPRAPATGEGRLIHDRQDNLPVQVRILVQVLQIRASCCLDFVLHLQSLLVRIRALLASLQLVVLGLLQQLNLGLDRAQFLLGTLELLLDFTRLLAIF